MLENGKKQSFDLKRKFWENSGNDIIFFITAVFLNSSEYALYLCKVDTDQLVYSYHVF